MAPKFPEKKTAPAVKTSAQGTLTKTFPVIVDGKKRKLVYEVPPELVPIFQSGNVDEIQSLTRDIIQEFAPETLQKDERYKYDKTNAALDPDFVKNETLKSMKELENKFIRSTALGRGYQDTLKWVQNEAEQYVNRADSPVAKLAGAIIAGTAEDAANPLATFESAVGNMYDPNATFEERFGAVGNAALYGLSFVGVAKAGTAGARAVKATKMAEQAIARGLRVKAGLVAFGRTYARETLLGGFAERKITISQLRKTLEGKGFTDEEIDDVINSQRQLYKI